MCTYIASFLSFFKKMNCIYLTPSFIFRKYLANVYFALCQFVEVFWIFGTSTLKIFFSAFFPATFLFHRIFHFCVFHLMFYAKYVMLVTLHNLTSLSHVSTVLTAIYHLLSIYFLTKKCHFSPTPFTVIIWNRNTIS